MSCWIRSSVVSANEPEARTVEFAPEMREGPAIGGLRGSDNDGDTGLDAGGVGGSDGVLDGVSGCPLGNEPLNWLKTLAR